jgi:hypothetical protein
VVPEDGTHYQLFCFHRLAYFVVHLMLALLLSLLTTLDEVMKGFILPRKMVEVKLHVCNLLRCDSHYFHCDHGLGAC